MADEKKDFKDKKGDKKGGDGSPASTEAMTVVAGLILASLLATALYNRLVYWLGGHPRDVLGPLSLQDLIANVPLGVKMISIGISVGAIAGLAYLVKLLTAINAATYRSLYPTGEARLELFTEPEVLNKKWQRVQEHLNSANPSDWKLAILEADIMLDEMLDKMGCRGETMGDKLKVVEKSDFLTLDLAWEAHKIRNSIAHEGGEFGVDHREAERVIKLYEEVFNEFEFI